MKTKEELNELKEEMKTLNTKLAELNEEELEQAMTESIIEATQENGSQFCFLMSVMIPESMSPGLFSVLKRREQLKCTCPPIKPKDRRLSTELKKYKVRLDAYKSVLTETRHNS